MNEEVKNTRFDFRIAQRWNGEVIPEANIPLKFRVTRPLKGGRSQVVDSRVPYYRFQPELEQYTPCLDGAIEDKDEAEVNGKGPFILPQVEE
jgi:hypothetical protein